ncbi:MAG: glycosyltransferase family 4 protein [Methanomicrobiales archaeon]|nr:glycosyltransferase family 4 protein [Methanomicrobiales archaeon]
MRINFIVEDLLLFKYVGCSTAARMLFHALKGTENLNIEWNSNKRDFDIVHFHTFGPRALLYRSLSGGVKILTAHSTPRLNQENLAFSGLINRFYPHVYRGFDHIIAFSTLSKEEAAYIAPEVPVTIIPNGVDRDYFQRDEGAGTAFRERYGIREGRVVLTVAQLTPRKGIYEFLKLARGHPDITWVWVGGFPYGPISRDYLKIRRIRERSGENVIFTGFVEDIREAYSGADLFFMPSYAEGMPIVLLEALSMGLPCVVRDIPEFREIFDKDGLYFGSLEEAGRIITSDEKLYQMSKRARQWSERYDIRRVAQLHAALYRRLIGG